MDAVTYNDLRQGFEAKTTRATDADLQFALRDIREALAVPAMGYVDKVSGLTDYQQKLFLERDEILTEMGRRVAAEMISKGVTL